MPFLIRLLLCGWIIVMHTQGMLYTQWFPTQEVCTQALVSTDSSQALCVAIETLQQLSVPVASRIPPKE
jgi:hypothetical protein